MEPPGCLVATMGAAFDLQAEAETISYVPTDAVQEYNSLKEVGTSPKCCHPVSRHIGIRGVVVVACGRGCAGRQLDPGKGGLGDQA